MHHVSCRDFAETSNHPGDSAPLQPRFGTLWLLAFPQTKITFERKNISDHRWDSGKYDRAADGDWKICVRLQGAYFEEDWGVIVLCTLFLVSCVFFNKCLYFSYYMDGYFMDRQISVYTHTHTWSEIKELEHILSLWSHIKSLLKWFLKHLSDKSTLPLAGYKDNKWGNSKQLPRGYLLFIQHTLQEHFLMRAWGHSWIQCDSCTPEAHCTVEGDEMYEQSSV